MNIVELDRRQISERGDLFVRQYADLTYNVEGHTTTNSIKLSEMENHASWVLLDMFDRIFIIEDDKPCATDTLFLKKDEKMLIGSIAMIYNKKRKSFKNTLICLNAVNYKIPGKKRFIFFTEFYVRNEYQMLGIGTQLINSLMKKFEINKYIFGASPIEGKNVAIYKSIAKRLNIGCDCIKYTKGKPNVKDHFLIIFNNS